MAVYSHPIRAGSISKLNPFSMASILSQAHALSFPLPIQVLSIDAKTKERIFEPFFITKTGNGKGRSLPIAYHIIKEHGRSMKVESTPGQGAVISLYLPLAKPERVNMIPISLGAPCGKAHKQLPDFISPRHA